MSILLTVVVAVAGWRLAKKLGLPAPAMLGSMLAVGITNMIFDYAYLPPYIKTIAQAVSGAFIGIQISKKDIRNFRYLFKPFLLLILLLTANTLLTGSLIRRITGIDHMTAMLGCVAGGVSDISLLSIDLGGDTAIVALMQTLRLVGVLLIFPYWVRFFTRKEGESEEDTRLLTGNLEPGHTWLDRLIRDERVKVVFTLAVSILTGFLGKWSGMPAGAMVFAMAAVALLNINTSTCRIPVKEKDLAQLMAGSVVGCSVTRAVFQRMDLSLFLSLVLLLVNYWLVNLFFSLYCKRRGLLDLKSAMLASAPGGATDMSLIAADLNADLTKIALIQVLRAVYAVTLMPAIIVLLAPLLG